MWFPVSGISKREVLKRIQEWEAKGCEVLFPIQTIKSHCNNFRYICNSTKSQNFTGEDVNVTYYTRMRKVG